MISCTAAPKRIASIALCLLLSAVCMAEGPIAGTAELKLEGDIASQLVAGVDRFLLGQLKASIGKREKHWGRDFSSAAAYMESVERNRQHLAHITGVKDQRVKFADMEVFGGTKHLGLVATSRTFRVVQVRWPVIRDIQAEGLLLIPKHPNGIDIVAIPDADQTPEMIVGIEKGVHAEAQYARRLAAAGCQVLVPTLISRDLKLRGHATMTDREYVQRSAFELGRHIIGYEIQKVLAGLDWFQMQADDQDAVVGVIGWGEGGLLALYSAALDRRIDAVCVSGYFNTRQEIWQEPISRNVFGLLNEFGDAELLTLVAPRPCVIEACRGPELELPPDQGGAPARLITPELAVVEAEAERAFKLLGNRDKLARIQVVASGDGTGRFGTTAALNAFLKGLGADGKVVPPGPVPETLGGERVDASTRQSHLLHQMVEHNQWLLQQSPFVRKEFMSRLDTSSLEKYEESVEWYRDYFRTEVVGQFDRKPLKANPRCRKIGKSDKWDRYEVVLDVFPDVIAHGILTMPRGIGQSERRPVVVCQHGLEGRPQSVIGAEDYRFYKAFATELAERGFITFAPQNIYIFEDRFRTLQRKSYPLKKTIFSIMVPQHQQILDWLKTLPQVDGNRIAFYGLSYGGKSAMRIPPLVTDYCLSICSADFNEWVRKNASTRLSYSYVWTSEYEIYEWDLGSTFNYAEMAALICPRPFMVERGHFDGVGTDDWVAYEFAKVRHLYQAKLGIGDRAEIEWFVGPHTINGQGTYQFLHRHLDWPEPERD